MDTHSIGYGYPPGKGKGKGNKDRGVGEGEKKTGLNKKEIEDGFNKFWEEYPSIRKTHKLETKEAWFNLKPSSELIEEIISKLIILKKTRILK